MTIRKPGGPSCHLIAGCSDTFKTLASVRPSIHPSIDVTLSCKILSTRLKHFLHVVDICTLLWYFTCTALTWGLETSIKIANHLIKLQKGHTHSQAKPESGHKQDGILSRYRGNTIGRCYTYIIMLLLLSFRPIVIPLSIERLLIVHYIMHLNEKGDNRCLLETGWATQPSNILYTQVL